MRRLCDNGIRYNLVGYLARNTCRSDPDAATGPSRASRHLYIDSCDSTRLSRRRIEPRGQGYLYFEQQHFWYRGWANSSAPLPPRRIFHRWKNANRVTAQPPLTT